MKDRKFRCWQVSINFDLKREYYYFSNLTFALMFIDEEFKKHRKERGYHPVNSANVMFKCFRDGKTPRILNGKRVLRFGPQVRSTDFLKGKSL